MIATSFFRKIIILLLPLTGFFNFTHLLHGQTRNKSFDYDSRPPMPYDFKNLELNLVLDMENMVLKGEVIYTVSPFLTTRDTLLLHAAHMDIKGVAWGRSEAVYTARNDTLMVAPPEAEAIRGKTYKLAITYEKQAEFGLLKSYRGTIRSSLLPKAHRHWLPVFDHPRNQLTTAISLSIPGKDKAVAMSGSFDQEEGVWTFNQPVPVTGLAFAIGDFESTETLAGIKKITLYSEKGLLTEQQKTQLLQEAHSTLTKTQSQLQIEFPFQSFDLVALEDHQWEQKQYGAGIGFIYENRGSLIEQARRVIQAQWAGILQREARWLEADVTNLVQTWLYQKIYTSDSDFNNSGANPEVIFDSVYQQFSDEKWNQWQYSYKKWESEKRPIAQVLQLTGNDFVKRQSQIYTWESFSNFLYSKTGYIWDSPPALSTPPRTDSVIYDVEYIYDEISNDLQLVFTANDSVLTSLVTALLRLDTGSEILQKEVVFSGTNDTLSVPLDNPVDKVSIQPVDSLNIYFDEHKPAMFWLAQLRKSPEKKKRVEAALKLGEHSENTDLQLALLDIMNGENSIEVKAALLKTLAAITNGAVGTEQQFLKELGSSDLPVRLAALLALKNYPDNEQVERRVSRILTIDNPPQLVKKGIDVYAVIADTADFISRTGSLLEADTTGQYVAAVASQLIQLGEKSRAITLYRRYLDAEYPYAVRRKMFAGLLEYPDLLKERKILLQRLLNDRDPRIRFIAVSLAQHMTEKEAVEVIENRRFEEYDARVYGRLLSALQQYENKSTKSISGKK